MTEFLTSLSQISPTVGVALIIYLIVKDFLKSKNSNGMNGVKREDKNQDIEIAVLKTQMLAVLTNHIPHIEQSLKEYKEEFKQNNLEHQKTQEMLVKLITKMNIQ